jgi:indole-3-glycerol phosphate synthase
MTILDKIIENKKKEVSVLHETTTFKELENSIFFKRDTVSLSEFLLNMDKTGIIAEFKRKSPSKGIINSLSSIEEVTSGYFREGASGVSILTDKHFFGGSIDDISSVRERSHFPILRKEFIVDEYQVIESKSIGADAILLIAAVLGKKEISNLSALARSLNMQVLLEIHEYKELDKLNKDVNIIGVNNRNLKTFEVKTDVSEMLAEKIPGGLLKISESGIFSVQVLKKLRSCGYNGFLIGERFMSSSDPVKSFSEFAKEIKKVNDKS